MSIVVRFKPSSLTAQTYDESTRQLEEAGVERFPEGLDYHVCFGTDGNLQVREIWDSPEHFEAFGERLRLMPVVTELGIEFSGPPEIFEGSQNRQALAGVTSSVTLRDPAVRGGLRTRVLEALRRVDHALAPTP